MGEEWEEVVAWEKKEIAAGAEPELSVHEFERLTLRGLTERNFGMGEKESKERYFVEIH